MPKTKILQKNPMRRIISTTDEHRESESHEEVTLSRGRVMKTGGEKKS
jgi:hypothetical protein